MTIIGANADVYPYHYKFQRERRRDGSTWTPSRPLPNYALRFVIAVCVAIFEVAWVVVR